MREPDRRFADTIQDEDLVQMRLEAAVKLCKKLSGGRISQSKPRQSESRPHKTSTSRPHDSCTVIRVTPEESE